MGNFDSDSTASSKLVSREPRSVPPAMNPRPPARDAATAKGAKLMGRMGALTMNGFLVHGNTVWKDNGACIV